MGTLKSHLSSKLAVDQISLETPDLIPSSPLRNCFIVDVKIARWRYFREFLYILLYCLRLAHIIIKPITINVTQMFTIINGSHDTSASQFVTFTHIHIGSASLIHFFFGRTFHLFAARCRRDNTYLQQSIALLT